MVGRQGRVDEGAADEGSTDEVVDEVAVTTAVVRDNDLVVAAAELRSDERVGSENIMDDSAPELEASLPIEVLCEADVLWTNGASTNLEISCESELSCRSEGFLQGKQ